MMSIASMRESARSLALVLLLTGIALQNWRQDKFLRRVTASPLASTQEVTNEPGKRSPIVKLESKKEHVQRDNWFNVTELESNPATKKCLFVENICHSTHRWFYDDSRLSKYQPDIQVQVISDEFIERNNRNYPHHVTVYRSSDMDLNMASSCLYSPIANHFVLQSIYGMLGEFYVRALMGFRDILLQQADKELFRQQTQFYLLTDDPHSQLLDSHRLFTQPFMNNPLLPFSTLMDNTECRCLDRLFLCGFRPRTTSPDDKFLPENPRPQPANSNETVFWERDYQIASSDYSLYVEGEPDRPEYRDTASHLRQGVFSSNPWLQQDARDHKKKLLIKSVLKKSDNLSDEEMDEWRLVGLTQRMLRRRWLEMETSLRRCNDAMNRHKILCVELNLEKEESNGWTQVVEHASIDMIIGVHGAQLVQTIWMKPESIVLELLPFIPPWTTWGTWARQITNPTPLGVIWTGTDLNHVGYRLKRSSIPFCHDKDFTETCYEKHEFDFQKSDVIVDPDIIVDAVKRFLIPSLDSCKDWEDASKDYVLYNINCSDGNATDTKTVHHFYRESEEDFEEEKD